MNDCIFCRIAAGTMAATEVYRDSDVVAIADLAPQAPVHLLVMPVEHHADVTELTGEADAALLAKVVGVSARLGSERGGSGFRLVVNTGPQGGQTVGHLHVHVLAGRQMGWPPG
jgi:histidine triad (HIT) family protein